MSKRVLVIGSAGYIGSHLTRRLQSLADTQDMEIYGLNRREDRALPSEKRLTGDLLAYDWSVALEEITPQVIYHMAGPPKDAPFAYQLLVHADGTRRLLQAITDSGQRPRVIIAGSAAEYGLRKEAVDEQAACYPEGEYGIAKLAQTQVARFFASRYALPVTVARIFNAYGQTARYLSVASIAAQIARSEALAPLESVLQVQNLQSSRDFIHIDDVVEALLALTPYREANGPKRPFDRDGQMASEQVYNIASGRSVPLSRIMEGLLAHTTMNEFELRQVDVRIQGRQQEDTSLADISRLRQHTDWVPQVTLAAGLRREMAYWREQLANESTQAEMTSQEPVPAEDDRVEEALAT